jgi:hypothetical protein
MIKQFNYKCHICGQEHLIEEEDKDEWITVKSKVLDVAVKFRSRLVEAIARHEIKHFANEHCVKGELKPETIEIMIKHKRAELEKKYEDEKAKILMGLQ